MHFPTDQSSIEELIHKIDPLAYAKTRNFIDGKVTYLSPYFSRGVIHAQQVVAHLQEKQYRYEEVEPLLKELAWREYYQRVWNHLGDQIDQDVLHTQSDVQSYAFPASLLEKTTGISSINAGIDQLEKTGYMHNHVRMYVASICCPIGKYHWKSPAKWMYYHLLDADWASNALSWQWVAGSFSQKKYYANQSNINTFTYSNDKGTFLDCSYEELPLLPLPKPLEKAQALQLSTPLPRYLPTFQQTEKDLYLFNFYNLDATWLPTKANAVLLLEPSFFEKYPSSQVVIDFMIALSKNIPHIQYFVGEFKELKAQFPEATFHYKQHPTNLHYQGTEHPREWLFPSVDEYFSSFSKYWKQCFPLAKKLFTS